MPKKYLILNSTQRQQIIALINKHLLDTEIPTAEDVILMNINKDLGKQIKDNEIEQQPNINDKIRDLVSNFKVHWYDKDPEYGKSMPNTPLHNTATKEFIESLTIGSMVLPIDDSTLELDVYFKFSNLDIQIQTDASDLQIGLSNIYITALDIKRAIYKKCQSDNRDFHNISYANFASMNFIHAQIAELCYQLLNKITNDDEFELSQAWKTIKLYMSFKGKDKKEIKNWRPMVSLPFFVKIVEIAMTDKIKHKLIHCNKIQSDVQKAHQTSSGVWEHVFELNCLMAYDIKNKCSTPMLFLDIKNAFGSVNYKKLIHILKSQKYPKYLWKYVEKYYKNLICLFNGKQIKWENGLLQGSGLSNILFLIYLDYVLKAVVLMWHKIGLISESSTPLETLKTMIRAFVDDIRIKFNKKQDNIPAMLEILVLVFAEYGLEINFTKTFMYGYTDKIPLSIGYEVIKPPPENFIYLGQPLFSNKESFRAYKYTQLKKMFTQIDCLDVDNNIKIYLYYINVFHRMNKFYELFHLFIDKKTYNILSYIERYYYSKWNINFTNKINATGINGTGTLCDYFDHRHNIYGNQVLYRLQYTNPTLNQYNVSDYFVAPTQNNTFKFYYSFQYCFGLNFIQGLPKNIEELNVATHFHLNTGTYSSDFIDGSQ